MANSRHRAGKSSGSHRHTEKMGPGSGTPAPRVYTGGPGKAAMRVTPHASARPVGGASSFSPGKMSIYTEE